MNKTEKKFSLLGNRPEEIPRIREGCGKRKRERVNIGEVLSEME